jgi:hypothetical protein
MATQACIRRINAQLIRSTELEIDRRHLDADGMMDIIYADRVPTIAVSAALPLTELAWRPHLILLPRGESVSLASLPAEALARRGAISPGPFDQVKAIVAGSYPPRTAMNRDHATALDCSAPSLL